MRVPCASSATTLANSPLPELENDVSDIIVHSPRRPSGLPQYTNKTLSLAAKPNFKSVLWLPQESNLFPPGPRDCDLGPFRVLSASIADRTFRVLSASLLLLADVKDNCVSLSFLCLVSSHEGEVGGDSGRGRRHPAAPPAS